MPFTPKREDGRAVWRVLYDYISDAIDEGRLTDGDVIPRDELLRVLEPEERQGYAGVINRAARQLREEHGRSLQAVRGKGYRLISGVAQADQGAAHKRKATRAFKRGLEIIETTDLSKLSANERTTIDGMRRGMNLLAMAATASWERLNRHEEALSALKKDSLAQNRALSQKATAEEVEELRRRLDELERNGRH